MEVGRGGGGWIEGGVMMDDIRERHGCMGLCAMTSGVRLQPINLRERDDAIAIRIGDEEVSFTPSQARYLARRLHRLARRVVERVG